MKRRIAIIGGGITGLTAAYYLQKRDDCEVTLIEASSRLGGKIHTIEADGDLLEFGADSFFTRKPWTVELANELGLKEQIVQPLTRQSSVLRDGKLYTVPGGLVTLTYLHPEELPSLKFLSPEGLAAVQAEPTVPKTTEPDESLASFFRRRLGREFSRYIAEPLLAGTHAGDPMRLSMRALYPRYWALEQEFGSLTAGMHQPHDHKEIRSAYASFKLGMEQLTTALSTALTTTEVLLDTSIDTVYFDEGVKVNGRTFDQTLLAVPAPISARLLQAFNPEASKLLRSVRHCSSAVINMTFENVPEGMLQGTGILVPYNPDDLVVDASWSTQKWPGRSAHGHTIIRSVLGRDGGLSVKEFDDDQLANFAYRKVQEFYPELPRPTSQTVQRWHDALPQYELGHIEKIDAIEAELKPFSIHLAGASYRGISIAECVRQGREFALSVAG